MWSKVSDEVEETEDCTNIAKHCSYAFCKLCRNRARRPKKDRAEP